MGFSGRFYKILIQNLVRSFIRIFIKYFIVFFAMMFILGALGQYKGQGKVDLPVTLTFSLLPALLGSAIAAFFIGVIRELDSAPPRVQSSEYLNVDASVINKQLSKIRRFRLFTVTMFFMWIPYGLFIMALSLPVFFAFAYMSAIAGMAIILGFSKCPRCNHYFFFRGAKPGRIGDTGNETLNLLFGGGYHNPLSNKCLNCGLTIKK